MTNQQFRPRGLRGYAGKLALVCLGATLAGHPAHTAEIDHDILINVDAAPGSWLTHGRSYSEARQSPLTRITTSNVHRLGLAWSFNTRTRRGLEATPLVLDGVIYTTGTWSYVYANNARTGELLWEYDPGVPRAWGVNACCDVVNRGVAAWGDNVYVGTLDGRLVALDRHTGQVRWEVLTIDPAKPYTITGAPRIVKGNVIIGNGGAEYGVRGYVSGYAADTGALNWRFYTVPGDPAAPFESAAMAMARQTWTGDLWWRVGGGGTVWDSMAYDPELDLLYVGVGNGSPWNRHVRSPGGGDNLFLSSIVALRPGTGEYVWHYQTTPGDTWDYTATQHMILADLKIAGVLRRVLLQAPKNGFFYVLDRESGELISADKYIEIDWASHVDPATGRPVETSNADHSSETRNTRPAPFGGHNWQPMAWNSATGLVYIPAMESVAPYGTDHEFEYITGGHWNTANPTMFSPPAPEPLIRGVLKRIFRGSLLAWDPVARKAAWRVEHPTMWNGGVLTTAANLVFQGTGDGRLVAYRADTGESLWEAPTGTGIVAPPISYEIAGEQFIAVMAGWGGAAPLGIDLPGSAAAGTGHLLVFKLDGRKLLAEPATPRVFTKPPARRGTTETINRGQELYNLHCGRCHGGGLMSGGLIPDLRHLDPAKHDLFEEIVLDGILRGSGMVAFADVLSKEDSAAIQDYVLDGANTLWENEQSPRWWRDIKYWFYDTAAAAISLFM